MIQKLITKYENLSKSLEGFETKGLVDNFLADLHKLQLKNGKLPIPIVRASALIKAFAKWNNKYPKGRFYSINSKDGMGMIRELDELADEAQEINKHLP